MNFQINSTYQGDITQTNEIQVKMSKVDDEKVCVEFMNLNGDSFRFLEHFAKFRDVTLKNMNDATV